MYPIMDGGNVNMWHDCMYVHYCFSSTFIIVRKQLPHATIIQLLKKSNMVNYICMYDMYKLPYRRPISNSLTITIQLIDF